MKKNRFQKNLLTLLITVTSSLLADETVLLRGVPDLEGPVVQHSPSADPVNSGSPVTISATVTDNVGVKYVIVNYRSAGSKEYRQAPMQQIGDNLYSATIPAVHVQNSALEYYLEAVDLSGNTVLRGLDFQPMIISVSPQTIPNVATESVPQAETNLPVKGSNKNSNSNNWIWWTIGAAVAGGAVYAFTRDSGGGGEDPSTGTIVITTPSPE